MVLELEVVEGGLLRVNSPELPIGSKISIPAQKGIRRSVVGDGSWESISEALEALTKLDVPRRSNEELIRELRGNRDNE